MTEEALVGDMQDQGTSLVFHSGQCMPSVGLQEGCTGPMYTLLCLNKGEKAQIKVWHELEVQEESILIWFCQPAPARGSFIPWQCGVPKGALNPRRQLGGRESPGLCCLSLPS